MITPDAAKYRLAQEPKQSCDACGHRKEDGECTKVTDGGETDHLCDLFNPSTNPQTGSEASIEVNLFIGGAGDAMESK